MKHIPFEIICRIADGVVSESELTRYLSHFETCKICEAEVHFQRTLVKTSKLIKLIIPSQGFKEEILENISPTKKVSWYSKLLQNMGNVIAMAAVLAFLAYIFSLANSSGLQIDKPTDSKVVSEFIKLIQDGNQKFTNLLILKLPKTSQSHNQTNTLTIAFLAFALLLLVDRITQLFLRRRN
jgi:hypothetical protein